MKLLDVDHILDIHQAGLIRYQGLAGLYPDSKEKVESILAQQYPVFSIEKYQTVFEKAAALLYFFSKGHCFPDGNKRVAIMTAIVFLDINGFEAIFTNDDGYNMTMEIASSQIDDVNRDSYIKWIAGWLQKNSKKHRRKRLWRLSGRS